MAGFFIALLSGALMSIQGVFNTQVTKTTGVWVSNGWVQITAFAVCLAAWLFTGRDSISALTKVEPKYMLLDRRRDHLDGYQEHRCPRSGEVRASHRDRAACGILYHPALRDVRHGQGAVLMAETGRACCGGDRDHCISVGVRWKCNNPVTNR